MFESYYPKGGIEDFKGDFDSVKDALNGENNVFEENTDLVYSQIVDTKEKVIYVREWHIEEIQEVKGFEIEILEL